MVPSAEDTPAGAAQAVPGRKFIRSESVESSARLFTEADRQRINDSVRAAEAQTSAEIVPVVATSSGRYDRAEDLVGLWLGVLLLVAVSLLWPVPSNTSEAGSWESDSSRWLIVGQALVVVIGFLLGAVISTRVAWLRRLFTPARQMSDEVQQAARRVFFDNRVHHTQGGSGLLIYLSLYERITVVLADQRVLELLGQPVLDELCRRLTEKLHQNHPTEALCLTIQAAGEKLKDVLPRLPGDINELPDSLITID